MPTTNIFLVDASGRSNQTPLYATYPMGYPESCPSDVSITGLIDPSLIHQQIDSIMYLV